MKKLSIILFMCSFISFGFSQKIQGDIAKDHRQLVTQLSDTIEGNINAIYTIQFSVDAKGDVTAVSVEDVKTEKKSTPARLKVLNYVKTFKFEPGTWFPKYHQGKVVIIMVKK